MEFHSKKPGNSSDRSTGSISIVIKSTQFPFASVASQFFRTSETEKVSVTPLLVLEMLANSSSCSFLEHTPYPWIVWRTTSPFLQGSGSPRSLQSPSSRSNRTRLTGTDPPQGRSKHRGFHSHFASLCKVSHSLLLQLPWKSEVCSSNVTQSNFKGFVFLIGTAALGGSDFKHSFAASK